MSQYKNTIILALLLTLAPLNAHPADFRSLDGANNNLNNPTWGQAGTLFLRQSTANYQPDGQTPVTLPNARRVSNVIVAQSELRYNTRNTSDFIWLWGQFIDHDLDLTPLQPTGVDPINITIPNNDPVFMPGAVIPMVRSDFQLVNGVRQHPNTISSFIDASNVYGTFSHDTSPTSRANWLRTLDGTGRLRTTTNPNGDLLPTIGSAPNTPEMAGADMLGPAGFVAGDIRANEQVSLTAMHTLFMREHNRLADIIAAKPDTASNAAADNLSVDDYIFQRARKIVGAELQAITYNEFLPALGISLDSYSGYDDSINPAIKHEFATAAYRMGHSMVSSTLFRLNEDGTTHSAGHLDLFQAFFSPDQITNHGIDAILRGLATNQHQNIDTQIIDDLRNLMFGPPTSGPVANGSDLAALNIQRGRDHGLPSFNTVREAFGLTPYTTINQITSDTALQDKIIEVYGDNINDIDLWIGILAEDHLTDSNVGQTLHTILADQFFRLRDGDRFFFLNDPDLAEWNTLTDDLTDLQWLTDLQLSDLLRLNTDIDWIQDNVFFAQSRPIPEPQALTLFLLSSLALLKRKAATKA